MKTSLLKLLQKEESLVSNFNSWQQTVMACQENNVSCDDKIKLLQQLEIEIQAVRKEIAKSLKGYL